MNLKLRTKCGIFVVIAAWCVIGCCIAMVAFFSFITPFVSRNFDLLMIWANGNPWVAAGTFGSVIMFLFGFFELGSERLTVVKKETSDKTEPV